MCVDALERAMATMWFLLFSCVQRGVGGSNLEQIPPAVFPLGGRATPFQSSQRHRLRHRTGSAPGDRVRFMRGSPRFNGFQRQTPRHEAGPACASFDTVDD